METLIGSQLKVLLQATLPGGVSLTDSGVDYSVKFYTDDSLKSIALSKTIDLNTKLFSTTDGLIAIVDTSNMGGGKLVVEATITVTDLINGVNVSRSETVREITNIKIYE
jgi:hypothetical protein